MSEDGVIGVIKSKSQEIDESIVRTCEKMMDHAAEGELAGCVTVFLKKDGAWGYAVSGSLDHFALVGAVECCREAVMMQLCCRDGI